MGVVHTSVHNGASVSVAHNLRLRYVTDKEEHIDPTLPHETWHHEDLEQAYERLFGQAIRDYNEKQKRKDRRISENYIKTIQEDPYKHTVYEFIIGVYPQDTDCPDWLKKAILQEYVKEFKENNPNLHVVGVYYHADEPDAEPHVHLDYIPVGHFKNYGMEVQNSLTRALKEQGMVLQKADKDKDLAWRTAQMQLQDRERDRLDAICRERGLDVEHPVVEGKQEAREHLETETYKAEKHLETTIDHYKSMESLADEQLRRADRADARAQKAVERAGRAQDAEQKSLARKKELQGEIRALKGDYSEQIGIQKKTAGKTLLGRPKKKIELDYTEYQALNARANAVTNLQEQMRQAERDRRDIEELRQKTFREMDAAERKMQDAVNRHIDLESREKDLQGTVEREVDKLLTTERTATEKAMRAFLREYKDANGKDLLEVFDAQEQERKNQRRNSRVLPTR